MLGRRMFALGCACCALSGGQSLADHSLLPEIPGAPPLSIASIAENIWLHTSWRLLSNGAPFPSNGLIVVAPARVLIVDTTWDVSDMAKLLDHVAAHHPGMPVSLAVTHAHDDRMSGVEIARQRGVESLAFHMTQADAPSRGLPLADRTWRGRVHAEDFGGRRVEFYYPGPAHTRDNVVAYVPDVGALFGGCQVRAADHTALGNVADANVAAWPAATRRLIARYGRRVRPVVPGHGAPGGPELLQHTLRLAEAAVALAQ